VRKISRTYGRGAKEFLVRNIPTISCPHCGESFLTAATLHELERIKADPERVVAMRRITVVDFPGDLGH
jgi:YgiT-type zinc finger domain-containing protein